MGLRPEIRATFAADIIPRRRSSSSNFGIFESPYKGLGPDMLNIRQWQSGDAARRLARQASAKSISSGGPPMVVEGYAERALSVVLVMDRFARMAAFNFSKHDCIQLCADAILQGAARKNFAVGFFDRAKGDDKPHFLEPREGRGEQEWAARRRRRMRQERFLASAANLDLNIEDLRTRARYDIVYIFSDFLGAPETPHPDLMAALAQRADVRPVVVQNSLFEMSFPIFSGTIPLYDYEAGKMHERTYTISETRELAEMHQARFRALCEDYFAPLGLSPLIITSTDQKACQRAFIEWNSRVRHRRV